MCQNPTLLGEPKLLILLLRIKMKGSSKMKLSSEQLKRLAERVFKVLKCSGHIELDS